MDNKNQNDNLQPAPDYGFILNQGGTLPPPKKSKKKFVILGVLGLLLVIMGAIILLAPRDESTKTASTAPSVGAPTAEAVTINFIGYIQGNQAEQAYTMFS